MFILDQSAARNECRILTFSASVMKYKDVDVVVDGCRELNLNVGDENRSTLSILICHNLILMYNYSNLRVVVVINTLALNVK